MSSGKRIEQFSDRTAGELSSFGWSIYDLTGDSPLTLKAQGRRFWMWASDAEDTLRLGSNLTQVAINPALLFLENSAGQTQPQQQARMKDFTHWLLQRYSLESGFRASLGLVADVVETTFQHHDATGFWLFGDTYDAGYIGPYFKDRKPHKLGAWTHTTTQVMAGRKSRLLYLSVGAASSDSGLGVQVSLEPEDGHGPMATPLLYPVNTSGI